MARVSLVTQAHAIVAATLEDGDIAIDATVGNGHDTLFLARQVGASGRVFGFDVQAEALAAAQRRLREAGVAERVTLFGHGHEQMRQQLPELTGQVRAIMFNLGYLPGSDKTRITTGDTTLSALQQSLACLAAGGVLTVLAYTGHAGGREEADRVSAWAQGLDPGRFVVALHRNEQSRGPSPELTVIQRCG